MWPWEHLAIGYVGYSVLSRLFSRRPPSALAAVAVAFGTQFPDLVDKPLSWVFGVLPSGTTFAHSLLTAVPLSLGVVLAARLRDRTDVGLAFAVGYLLHLPADVFYPVAFGSEPKFWMLLWPLVPSPAGRPAEIGSHVRALADSFLELLASPAGMAYLTLELALLVAAAALWLRDGRPGFPTGRPNSP